MKRVLISKKKIDERVKQLALKLTKDYKDKLPIVIGILNGSFIFLSDLVRQIKTDLEIDFLKLSSYGDRKISSGEVTLLKELNCDIHKRHVLLVEDIIDTGISAKYMRELMLKRKPASLEFVTLLHKTEVSKLDFKIKYVGFNIPNEFVVGYGLDFAQKYRNLKSIHVLKN